MSILSRLAPDYDGLQSFSGPSFAPIVPLDALDERSGLSAAEWDALVAADDRDDAEAATLRYPGFLSMTDAALIDVIANPFVMPHDDRDVMFAEAAAEILRRLQACNV